MASISAMDINQYYPYRVIEIMKIKDCYIEGADIKSTTMIRE